MSECSESPASVHDEPTNHENEDKSVDELIESEPDTRTKYTKYVQIEWKRSYLFIHRSPDQSVHIQTLQMM